MCCDPEVIKNWAPLLSWGANILENADKSEMSKSVKQTTQAGKRGLQCVGGWKTQFKEELWTPERLQPRKIIFTVCIFREPLLGGCQ